MNFCEKLIKENAIEVEPVNEGNKTTKLDQSKYDHVLGDIIRKAVNSHEHDISLEDLRKWEHEDSKDEQLKEMKVDKFFSSFKKTDVMGKKDKPSNVKVTIYDNKPADKTVDQMSDEELKSKNKDAYYMKHGLPFYESADASQDPPREEQKKALSDLEFSYDKKYNAFCLSVSGYSTEKLEGMLQKKTEELKAAKEEKQKAPTRYSRMAAQIKIDYLVNVTNRCKAMIRKKKSYHKAEEKK